MSRELIAASQKLETLRALLRKADCRWTDPALEEVRLSRFRGWVLAVYREGVRPSVYGFNCATNLRGEFHEPRLWLTGNYQPPQNTGGVNITATGSGNARMTIAGSGDMVTHFGRGGEARVQRSGGETPLNENEPKLVVLLPPSREALRLHLKGCNVSYRHLGAGVVQSVNSTFSHF